MTNFAVQATLGAAAPLVSKEKGTMGNRMDCAGEQIKNSVKTGLQGSAVAAGAIGTTYGIVHNKTMANAAAKVFDKTLNGIGKLFGKKDLAQIVDNKLLKTVSKYLTKDNAKLNTKGFYKTMAFDPKTLSKIKTAKGIALVSAIALPVLGYIRDKHIYKMGQIDQKYTDKASLQKTL